MLLGGAELEFYKYHGDVKQLLEVRYAVWTMHVTSTSSSLSRMHIVVLVYLTCWCRCGTYSERMHRLPSRCASTWA